MPLTGDQYAQVAADAQAQIAAIITGVVTEPGPPPVQKALVLIEDPVNLDEMRWAAALLSENDKDASGDKRVHAWVITFAGTEPETDTGVHELQSVLPYRVQFFYSLEPGSEAVARGEVMRAQFALAGKPDFDMKKVGRHYNLKMPIRLAKMGDRIVHRGDGELRVSLHPIGT